MKSLLLLTLIGAALQASAAQPAALDRALLTGTWDRDHVPQADPNKTSATPVEAPPLKARYLSEWQARQKAAREADARGQPLFTGYTDCQPDGMPTMMMAMFPMQVLSTPGQITIIQEAYRQVRYIYLDQKQEPIADAEPGFWGHSVGHWEGDTLVVNTVGIKENVRFRDAPHSDRMQVDERIRLLSPDRFEDRITITDPAYLEHPWQVTWRYHRRAGYKMMEYVCEANREYRDPKTGGTRLQVGIEHAH